MVVLGPAARGTINQYIAGITGSLSLLITACTYGWISPLLNHLLGPESEIPLTEDQLSWVVSIVSIGCMISPLPAGILSNYFGRKVVILSMAPINIFSWLLVLYLPSVPMLIVARVIQGVLFGIGFTVVPVYLGEISGEASRGAIASLFYINYWFGLLVAYTAGSYLDYYTFTYFTLSLNVPFILLFCWQPETPCFCLMVRNEERALQSLAWLRGNPPENKLKEELEEIKRTLEEKRNSAGLKDILYSSVDRKSMIFLLVLTAVRITSGIGTLSVLALKIFDMSPNEIIPSEQITIILGVVMLSGSSLGLFLSDRLGRRPLLLISCVGSLICQFLVATYYLYLFKVSVHFSEFSWVPAVLLLSYTAICTAGIFPVGSAYTSELFNSNTRSIASSVASIMNSCVTFILLLIFEPVVKYFGAYTIFYFHSVCLLLGLIYFYLFAPETKGKTFAQIMDELKSKEKHVKKEEVVKDA